MSTLPAAGVLGNTAAGHTNAQFSAEIEDVRDWLVETVLGAAARYELTIATGVVTPPDGATGGGAIFKIDTEANAATDDLDVVAQTNTHDGQVIYLMAENTARVATLRHAIGGAGQLLLADATNYALNHPDRWVAFRRNSTDWVEFARGYGADSAGSRNFDRVPRDLSGTILAPVDRLVVNRNSASVLGINIERVVLTDTNGTQWSINDTAWSGSITLSSTGANGRDIVDNGGLEQASTWYHLFAIANASGTKAFFASQVGYPGHATSIYTRLPSGYIYAAYLGAWYNDAASDLVAGKQYGNSADMALTQVLSAGTATTITSISLVAAVPITARKIKGIFRSIDNSTNNPKAQVYADVAGLFYIGQHFQEGAAAANAIIAGLIHTPQTVWYANTVASTSTTIWAIGWEF